MSNLDSLFSDSQSLFELQHEAREHILGVSRKVIQLASKAIRSAHRKEYEKAQEIIDQAKELIDSCQEQKERFPAIISTSIFYDAQKEYVEACVVLAMILSKPLPTREVLQVEPAAYVNGVVEAASEMRRSILDLLRGDDMTRAEELLGVMDDIYTLAISVDFPDALTHSLRRTTDAFRAVLERTRGDVTTASVFLRARSSAQS